MQEFLKKPSTDFGAVRDGRQALPFYIDIDLTTARSIAAGTAMKLDIAGNSFFTDADTTNGGNAIVHFQDVSLGNSSAPFFVSPGFIANVGFTQLLIENTAQTGKRMRIFYGVDIDFQAGINASIAISGTVAVSSGIITPRPEARTGSYNNGSLLTANTAVQVFAAASNVNGAIIQAAHLIGSNGGVSLKALLAKATAPANVNDGEMILATTNYYGGSTGYAGALVIPQYVPAGLGLYVIAGAADTSISMQAVQYKLL